jgi:hypothetical protein
MYDAGAMSERLLRDPRFSPHHVVGALLDGRVLCSSHLHVAAEDTAATLERIRALLAADRLRWFTRGSAVQSGRVDCEECGHSLPGVG